MTSSSINVANDSAQRRPSWWERNWKWFLPALIVAAVLVIGSFLGGLFWFIPLEFKGSYPYQLAVEKATTSPQVIALVGSPMQVGWLITGGFNMQGQEADSSMSIPISGPKAKGRIAVIAKKRSNHWAFETFEVLVEGRDQPIELDLPDGVTDARATKAGSSP